MTEPENFDDELFADLYNDDEPGNKAAAAPIAPQAQAAQHAAEVKQEHAGGGGYDDEYEGDRHMNNDDYDDDDDVDFNLGNGPTADVSPDEEKPTLTSYNAPPPPPPPSKGPNAKEDG